MVVLLCINEQLFIFMKKVLLGLMLLVFSLCSFKGIGQEKLDKYNEAGQFHNEGLKFIISKINYEKLIGLKTSNGEIDEQKVVGYILPYYNEFISKNNFTIEGKIYNCDKIDNSKDFLDKKSSLKTVFEKCSNLDNKSSILSCIDEYVDGIDEENTKILISANIYKYSVDFWEDFTKTTNFFDNIPAGNVEKIKFNWWMVAVSDASWARNGFIIGGGPAGAVSCALMGSAYSMCIQCMVQSR